MATLPSQNGCLRATQPRRVRRAVHLRMARTRRRIAAAREHRRARTRNRVMQSRHARMYVSEIVRRQCKDYRVFAASHLGLWQIQCRVQFDLSRIGILTPQRRS